MTCYLRPENLFIEFIITFITNLLLYSHTPSALNTGAGPLLVHRLVLTKADAERRKARGRRKVESYNKFFDVGCYKANSRRSNWASNYTSFGPQIYYPLSFICRIIANTTFLKITCSYCLKVSDRYTRLTRM